MKKETIKLVKKVKEINDAALIISGSMLALGVSTKAPEKVLKVLSGTFVMSLATTFVTSGIIFFGSEPKEVTIPVDDVEDLDQEFEDDLDPEPTPESEPKSVTEQA